MTEIELAGRALLVGFFLVAGVLNLTPQRIRDHIDRMKAFGTPLPAAAFWFGIALQFSGCAMIVSGAHAALGTIFLIVFTVAASAIFHRFWQRTDPMQRNMTRLFFLNNCAIVGGLLLLLKDSLR